MTERSITGFEAAPQGQIGSGFAQVFDTSNLVQAAVQMRQVRQQQFDALISSLADIDPTLAHPKDTEKIIYGVNQLQDFVIENYQSIADPRKDPSAAIEFKRRKNQLMAGVHQSKKMGELAVKHAGDMTKNSLHMGAYDRNAALINRLNSEEVFTLNDDGSLSMNPDVQGLFSQNLSIGMNPLEFADKIAKNTKQQFDPNNPDITSIKLSNGNTLELLNPDLMTDEQANQMIADALTGQSVDAIAVPSNVLGREALFDDLSDDEKTLVLDAVRPLYMQRLDTKPMSFTTRPRAVRGRGDKAFNVDVRNRSLLGLTTGVGGDEGILSDQQWGQRGGVVNKIDRVVNENGELVLSVELQDGNTLSTVNYAIGRKDEDGNLLALDDAGSQYLTNIKKFLSAANFSLNRSQGGDLKTPDIEDINEGVIAEIKSLIESGNFAFEVSEGKTYEINGKPATLAEVKSSLNSTIGDVETTRSTQTAVNDIAIWAQENGFATAGNVKVTHGARGKVVLAVGDTKANYNLKDPASRAAFIDAYVKRAALPSGKASPKTRMPVKGSTKPINPFE